MVLSVSVVHPRDCMADGGVAHGSSLPLPGVTGGHPDQSSEVEVQFLLNANCFRTFEKLKTCQGR